MKSINILVPEKYNYDNFYRKPAVLLPELKEDNIKTLINASLSKSGKWPYILFGKFYNNVAEDALSLEVEKDICIISGYQRGVYSVICVFPSNELYFAAEYFVWLVSEGHAKLNS
jgi:hypothetical protein